LAEARDAIERWRAAVEGIGEPVMEALADFGTGLVDVWQGEHGRALERLQTRLGRTLKLGAGLAIPWLLVAIALGELAAGQWEQARGRLEGLLPLIDGRDGWVTSYALGTLAEARRLLADRAAEATALQPRRAPSGSAIACSPRSPA
jgi:hypothetical protein